MTPYERMERMYLHEPEAQTFGWYVDWHMRHGFVFARPDYFVMGRPVQKDAQASYICDPTYKFPSAYCDCWYIHAMAGNLAGVWDHLPWFLPWIAWQRAHDPEKVLRVYPLYRMRSLSQYHDATVY